MIARISTSTTVDPHLSYGDGVSLSEASFTPPRHEEYILSQAGAQNVLRANDTAREAIASNFSETVLTHETAQFAKVLELHSLINSCATRLGAAVLLRDMLQPPTEIEEVRARQESIRELRENSGLCSALRTQLMDLNRTYFRRYGIEECALRFFAPDVADRSMEHPTIRQLIGEFFFSWFNSSRPLMKSVSAIGAALDRIDGLPEPRSPLLRYHVEQVRSISRSPDRALLDGRVYRTPYGVDSPARVPWYVPAFSLTSKCFSMEEFVSSSLTSMAVGGATVVRVAVGFAPSAVSLLVSMAAITQAVYSIGRNFFGKARLIQPLRERIEGDRALHRALDSLGSLEALLCLSTVPDRFGEKGSFPVLEQGDSYHLSARQLHNPSLLLRGHSVPSDVTLSGGEVQLVTGPNSGGKTTYATALLQNQILAQLGTAVAARQVRMTVADQILYQGPVFTALGNEGRLGTELKASRDLFLRSTPRTLAVMDEVGDGTTADERTEQSRNLVWAFSKLGAGTVLVTHNIPLAKRVAAEGIARPMMLEWDTDRPTFKVIPGISEVSHADRIARAIGFTPYHIEAELRRRGRL